MIRMSTSVRDSTAQILAAKMARLVETCRELTCMCSCLLNSTLLNIVCVVLGATVLQIGSVCIVRNSKTNAQAARTLRCADTEPVRPILQAQDSAPAIKYYF